MKCIKSKLLEKLLRRYPDSSNLVMICRVMFNMKNNKIYLKMVNYINVNYSHISGIFDVNNYCFGTIFNK